MEIRIEIIKIKIANPKISISRELMKLLKPLGKKVELLVELKSFILAL